MARKRVLLELRVRQGLATGSILSFAADALQLPGVEIDFTYTPVPVPPPADMSLELADAGEEIVVVRAEIEEGQESALARARSVVGKPWTDAQIVEFRTWTLQPAPDLSLAPATGTCPCASCDCKADESGAKGDIAAVASYLGSDRVWAAGFRGQGIVIGICDTGVRRSAVSAVIDGWSPPGTSAWGDDSAAPHGTMCATDALGQCPDARVLDIGILKSQAPGSPEDPTAGLLSDAIAGYEWALQRYRRDGTPQVLSNSWGMYQKSWGPDYATDPDHPFTRKVVQLIDAGILVCFAAGNCGSCCPSSRCGPDVGPGKSIYGANGHPRVITVGAANIHDEWIGYTSQGPAALDPNKPDVCAPSHYRGFTANDNGTSAACPTLAGVLGLLRCASPSLRQDDAKAVLQRTARDICGPGWNPNGGYGMIQAGAALDALQVGGAVGTPQWGVQFRGPVPANQTQRWFTDRWPAGRNVLWSVVPTSSGGPGPQIRWRVQTERASDGSLTYWISVTNLTDASVDVEGRYGLPLT
jgi:hypothetical protein